MYWIGIDNGVTGSIGIIKDGKAEYFPMPVKSEQSYTKAKQSITRINFDKLIGILSNYLDDPQGVRCMIERPMVNPARFKASASALRALESTIIVLEKLGIPYQYVDSKEWQKALLPKGRRGPRKRKRMKINYKANSIKLKNASCDIACRLFPSVRKKLISISKRGNEKKIDGDSLLIAEYFRRFYVN